ADPLRAEDTGGLARDEEVATREDVVVAVPQLEARLLDRRARSDARIRDDDVDPAEGEDSGAVGPDDGLLVQDVGARADRRVPELGSKRPSAVCIEIGHDDA